MKEIIQQILNDPEYSKNIEFGEPRAGHPEGKIKFHIADLEDNLESLRVKGITEEEFWKLKFLIHTHDICKPIAQSDTPTLHPNNHATLAKHFANRFTDDTDLLNIIQYHDENYELWKEYKKKNEFNRDRFQKLLAVIDNWDLFLMFTIIDGCVKGKDHEKVAWFIDRVREYKKTKIDSTWVLPLHKS